MSLQNKSKVDKPKVVKEEEEEIISSTEPTTTTTPAPTTTTTAAPATPAELPAVTTPTVNEEDIAKPTPPPKQVQEAITQVVNNATVNATETVPPALTGPVKTLKDAFPDLDVDIIEAILQNHGGNVDGAFETLLGMSDPNYKPVETSSSPDQHEDQLRQDEAYARQLVADEANSQGQNTNQQQNEPLFNFQEDLPAIKEKAIEIGTAAKNKIMSFYNQLVSGDSMSAGNTISPNNNQGNTLERDMGNLNISDNQNNQPQQQHRGSVDLYEWDGRPAANNNPPPPVPTSTSDDQLLADEEFARQLAKEDAEAAAVAANSATMATTAPQSVPVENSPIHTPPPPLAKNINVGPLKSGKLELAKDNDNSSSQDEVTFTTPDNQGKVKGFVINDAEDDDLDDLFIRDDSNFDAKSDSKSESKVEKKK